VRARRVRELKRKRRGAQEERGEEDADLLHKPPSPQSSKSTAIILTSQHKRGSRALPEDMRMERV
jgi:hypothetical protein